MNIIETNIPGVVVYEPKVFGDDRGFFIETFHEQRYLEEGGLSLTFVQDNQSRSAKGVLRGLHYQLKHPQGKLVRVTRGTVFDVAVDIRVGSPTFGQSFGTILDDQDNRQMYVPPGLAHGFCVISDVADFVYKCTDYYHPEDEGGVLWNDPDLGIDWPLDKDIQLSDKDKNSARLRDIPADCLPKYHQDAVA